MGENDKSLQEIVFDNVQNFVNEPRITQFLYQLLIIGSGMILIIILSNDKFPIERTIWVMLAWFTLVIVFPVPEKAKSNIEPFTKDTKELTGD